MDGEIQGILKPRNDDEIRRFKEMGIEDYRKPLGMEDLAKGDVMFAATGVTWSPFLKGVRFQSRGMAATESVVMRSRTKTIRFISAIHHLDRKPNI